MAKSIRFMALLAVVAICSRGGAEEVGAEEASETLVRRATHVIRFDSDDRAGRPPVVTAVAVRSGGDLLAVAGDDHLVRLRFTTDGKLHRVLRGHTDWVRAVVFSPDGKTLYTAGDDRRIKRWDVESGEPLADVARLEHAIHSLAISGDGRRLAAAGFHQSLTVHDTLSTTAKPPVFQLKCPCKDMRAVAFSADGRRLAAAGRNGEIRVWNIADGSVANQWAAHRQRIRSLAFSPQGQMLASAGEDRMLRIWDARSGRKIRELSCRPAKVMSVLFLDAKTLATAGSDNLICLWDLQSGNRRVRLAGHTGSVAAIAYDRQASVLVSGSYDTTVRIWRLTSDVAGASQGTTTLRPRTERPTR